MTDLFVAAGDPVRREHWGFYRVLSPPKTPAAGRRRCFGIPLVPSPGEDVTALALFAPEAWGEAALPRVRFELAIAEGNDETVVAREVRTPGRPGPPLRASLDSYADRDVLVRFCVIRRADEPQAGFGEPRIVRRGSEPGA